jgi:RHS repeat-associated protein
VGNTFNADNEMTVFNGTPLAYDANGNLTSDGANSYAWDARDHLSAISGANTASFVYDPFGRRMSKTIGGIATQFLYDGLNPVQELQAGIPSANLLTGLGIDEYFQRTDSAGARDFLTDTLGSTLALADATGAIQTSYTYEPFGNTAVSGASSANPFQFTSRENDGTGLYFYRSRYYSPMYQRFAAQDPLDFGGGDANLYSYVANSPLEFTDPTGESVANCLAKIAALMSALNNLRRRINERQAVPPDCRDEGHKNAIKEAKNQVNKTRKQAWNACKGHLKQLAELELILEDVVTLLLLE